jgi:hypothetical protein
VGTTRLRTTRMGTTVGAHPDRIARAALAVLILVALVWVDARILTGTENTADGGQYERLGVELARTGAFTASGAPTREVEPLHVALIALQVRLDPRLAEARATGVVAEGEPSRALKQLNLLWGALLLSGVAAQVRLLQQGRRGRTLTAAVAVVAVTVLLLENPDVVDRNLAELPAGALVVWCGVAATRFVRRPGGALAVGLGALLGALALTRAVFAYVAIPYVALLVLLLWLHGRRSAGPETPATPASSADPADPADPTMSARRLATLVLAGLVGFGVVVGPWAVRNTLTFGDPSIAERGGEVLTIRANKNRMDGYQLRGAVVHWTPTEGQPLLARLLRVDLADFALDRPLAVLMRDADDDELREQAIYRRTQAAIAERTTALVAEGESRPAARGLAEAEYGALALQAMRDDPLATLRTTPAFLWRFSWSMNASSTVPRPLLALISLGGMAALLTAAAWALVRRRPELFAFVGLPAGATAFSVLVTHALSRYARPLAPTMVILMVVVAARLVERVTAASSR